MLHMSKNRVNGGSRTKQGTAQQTPARTAPIRAPVGFPASNNTSTIAPHQIAIAGPTEAAGW
jgi:hypothetical protein